MKPLDDLDGTDLGALVFVVLANSTRDLHDDLEEVIAAARALHRQKSALRELLDTIAREDAELAERLRCEYEELFVSTDEDELGEASSLRLQMALERRSKLLETLANVLKKLSDTENSASRT